MTPVNDHDEIAALKRRVGGIEYELGQIKARIAELEASPAALVAPVASEASPAPQSGEVLPPALTDAVAASTPVIPPAAPSQLPPVLPPPLRPPESQAADPVGPRSSQWREWLEPLQLWPPAGEENAEVRLAAWWATRVGALLAVIGVVFLGIYVSRDSAPWIRLAEVVAVTAGVLALGGWLERKLPKFGGVVFGAGLALSYFCAFAAHSVGPMKVIASPVVAMACELVVVAGILAVAWVRSTPVVATMAVALGHVTAFLALRHDAGAFGPWVVLMLAIASVWLRLARGWEAPSLVAMPLAWGFLVTAMFAGAPRFELRLMGAWTWVGLYFALFTARDWLVAWRGETLSTLDRALQVSSSGLAVAAGLAAAARVGDAALTPFYFGSGVVMLATALAWRHVNVTALVPIFVCKAATLVGLGVIAAFEGHARHLVLLAQAFVLLESARRSQVRGLKTTAWITAAVAFALYVLALRPQDAALFAGATLAEIAFLAGAAAFIGHAQRSLDPGSRVVALPAVLVGVAAVVTVGSWHTSGWSPAAHVGLAAAVVVVGGIVSRSWFPATIIAAMLVTMGHVEMVLRSGGRFPATRWGNELVLIAAAVAGGWASGLPAMAETARLRLRGSIAGVSLATLVAVFFQQWPAGPALLAGTALALAVVAVAPHRRGWPLVVLSTPLCLLACLLYAEAAPRADGWVIAAALCAWAVPIWLAAGLARTDESAESEWLRLSRAIQVVVATALTFVALRTLHGDARVAGTAGAAVAVAALVWWPGLKLALEASWALWLGAMVGVATSDATPLTWTAALAIWAPGVMLARVAAVQPVKLPPPGWRANAEGNQAFLATLLGLVLALQYHGTDRLFAFALEIGVAFFVWSGGGLRAARTATLVLASALWLAAMSFATSRGAQGWGAGLAVVLGVSALTAVLPFPVARDFAPPSRLWVRWIGATAALLLAFHVLLVQRGNVAPYATVGWGSVATAMFLLGLFARSRPHRLVGLAGLALCVPRAFIVDLDSTLHRIAAFVALGAVLLWVGFSYHRFRHLIGDEAKKL